MLGWCGDSCTFLGMASNRPSLSLLVGDPTPICALGADSSLPYRAPHVAGALQSSQRLADVQALPDEVREWLTGPVPAWQDEQLDEDRGESEDDSVVAAVQADCRGSLDDPHVDINPFRPRSSQSFRVKDVDTSIRSRAGFSQAGRSSMAAFSQAGRSEGGSSIRELHRTVGV